MRSRIFTLLLCLISISSYANFVSPNTGVTYSLQSLVAASAGAVTFDGSSYLINDTITISLNDKLNITSSATVKFATNTYIYALGVLTINPASGSVIFTAQNATTRFHGMRIENSASYINKLNMELGNAIRLFDCNMTIENSSFTNMTNSSSFGNAAISLFRSNPVIRNCSFTNNIRAAISGGANIANAPAVYSCTFRNNNTSNANVPQINLGASGMDTTKIIGNLIYGGPTNSGGIAIFPLGTGSVIIKENIIRKNRYGITLIGGNNVNAIISYNIIDSNNIQGDPNLGGSGIAFNGGSATSNQNTIVTGNTFTANLWGITILAGSKPNLGDLTNTDTTDDGKNIFINNTNANTPGQDLYNNAPYDIMAQGNDWRTMDSAQVEAKIFHKFDDPALGFVNYSDPILPLSITEFTVVPISDRQTNVIFRIYNEQKIDRYEVERGFNQTQFSVVATIHSRNKAVGAQQYLIEDKHLIFAVTTYYRLKIIDKKGKVTYSDIVSRPASIIEKKQFRIYPSPLTRGSDLYVNVISDKDETVTLRMYGINGAMLFTYTIAVKAGEQVITLPKQDFHKGVVIAKWQTATGSHTQQIIVL